MPKFSANIIYLFTESDLIDRIKLASAAGFQGIECQRPFSIPGLTVKDLLTEHELEMVLINTPPSVKWPKDSGIAIFPERIHAFQELAGIAINYAVTIGCPRLHVVAGNVPKDFKWQVAEETYLSNLIWAAELGLKNGIKILIEPLNAIDNPNYFLTTTAQAIDLLSLANHKNLYLQYDLYHAGMNGEEIIPSVRQYLNNIEHMQMAGVPGRNEPDTGNIDMLAIFAAIDKMDYHGWVGAEYNPSNSTSDSFLWGRDYGIG